MRVKLVERDILAAVFGLGVLGAGIPNLARLRSNWLEKTNAEFALKPGVAQTAPLSQRAPSPVSADEIIFVDLDKPAGPIRVTPGRNYKIRVRLFAPGQRLRARNSLNVWLPLAPPQWQRILPLGPVCATRQARLMEILASQSVAETRRKVEAFRAAGTDEHCPQLEAVLASSIEALSPAVYQVSGGSEEPGELVVERLDDSSQPVETWRWTIAALQPAPLTETEESWIIRSVTEQIAALASPGAESVPNITTEKIEGSRYRLLSADPLLNEVTIEASPFIWDPMTFRRVAQAVLKTEAGPTTSTPPEGSPLSILMTPTAQGLSSLERQLNSRLAEFPYDPRAHEAFALLLGTLGLRHSDGPLADVRPVLNRITAHLALASAIGARASSIEGKLARIILDLLVRRERSAAAALTDVPAASRRRRSGSTRGRREGRSSISRPVSGTASSQWRLGEPTGRNSRSSRTTISRR